MPATMVMSPSVIASLSQCERAGWEGRCHPAPKQSGGSQKDCVTSFGRSPREQQRSACRSEDSALFLSADVALIERIAGELDPPIVHLGASSELLHLILSWRCESPCQRPNSCAAYLSPDLRR